jgi:hypothetical protein
MATIKKAQGGGLIKKVIKEATKNAPKVSKWDYPTKKSRDFQRDFLEAYPEKIKKMPTGTNKIDKVKEVKPKYDKNGLEILKDKNGGAVKKKMKMGGMVKKAQKGVNLPPALQQTGKPSIKNSGYIANTSEEMSKVKKYSPSKEGFKSVNDTTYKRSTRKYKNGGSLSGLKASNKRIGPVDPKGAFTKVQKKTLAGAKGKASLTKDKQLGATKMAKRGMSVSKKK